MNKIAFHVMLYNYNRTNFFWWKKLNSILQSFLFPQTTKEDYICDEYFENNEVRIERGIKGLASGVIMQNIKSQYYDVVSTIIVALKSF